MSETKTISTHCAIVGCKSTIYNKGLNVTFHPFPSANEMKNKWLINLKGRCPIVDWNRSKICSKHFEHKFFDSSRKLKDGAIPTIFPNVSYTTTGAGRASTGPKNKVERLLSRLTQQQLQDDIKGTMSLIKVPDNFSDCVDNDLQCVSNTPVEAQLWLLIQKQEHLIMRLTQHVSQNKKHVEILQKNMEDSRSSKKSTEQNMESYKYLVKCLQEKQATLEEQIEILSAVESR